MIQDHPKLLENQWRGTRNWIEWLAIWFLGCEIFSLLDGKTTLNVVFSATQYVELCNAIHLKLCNINLHNVTHSLYPETLENGCS